MCWCHYCIYLTEWKADVKVDLSNHKKIIHIGVCMLIPTYDKISLDACSEIKIWIRSPVRAISQSALCHHSGAEKTLPGAILDRRGPKHMLQALDDRDRPHWLM